VPSVGTREQVEVPRTRHVPVLIERTHVHQALASAPRQARHTPAPIAAHAHAHTHLLSVASQAKAERPNWVMVKADEFSFSFL
jgi:hypothetical protein